MLYFCEDKKIISIKSKVTQSVLNYFFLNKGKSFYINELGNILSVNVSNLYKILIKLEKEGLLISEFQGKERYFSLNKKFPLLSAYEEIIKKTIGLSTVLKKYLGTHSEIEHIYIYGSYAKGNFSETSDIDILIIGTVKRLEIVETFSKLEKEFGREFNYITISPEEFGKKRNSDPFLIDVFSGKIIQVV